MTDRMITTLTLGAFATLFAAPVMAQDAVEGAVLYNRHCAACHGADASGNGPMAPVLTLQPPDLTELRQRHDGAFPVARVVARIDGRDPLVAHGSPMPVYGDFFEGVQSVAVKAETGQPMLVSQSVADLLVFLQEIQS